LRALALLPDNLIKENSRFFTNEAVRALCALTAPSRFRNTLDFSEVICDWILPLPNQKSPI
jgi:hypothetical protein